MKRVIILILVITFPTVSLANSTVYTFQPDLMRNHLGDLEDLDHYHFYIWKVSVSLPNNENFTEANLFIKNINNYIVEDDDILYIRLLSKDDIDNAVTNLSMDKITDEVFRAWDDRIGGDNLSGYGNLLTTFTDDDDEPNPAEDFSYTFNSSQISSLNSYVKNDGIFGIGFDPDCHFYNEGITFTAKTPAPAAIVLAGIGMSLVGCLHRRRVLN